MKFCLDCKKQKSRKGLYCKYCGYKHRIRPSGLKYKIVVKNKGWFKKGEGHPHNKNVPAWNKGLRGIHLSPFSEFKKGMIAWNKGLSHMQDENHPLWKGNNVGYDALHSWIYRKLGQPNFCNRCKTTKSKRFMWHNINKEYKRDLIDWERLCSKCHANEHKNWGKR